nr:hypothetical protein Itr_chr14CG08800 [Ipomoea trifida]
MSGSFDSGGFDVSGRLDKWWLQRWRSGAFGGGGQVLGCTVVLECWLRQCRGGGTWQGIWDSMSGGESSEIRKHSNTESQIPCHVPPPRHCRSQHSNTTVQPSTCPPPPKAPLLHR